MNNAHIFYVATVTPAGCCSTKRVRSLRNRLSRVANAKVDVITTQSRTRESIQPIGLMLPPRGTRGFHQGD